MRLIDADGFKQLVTAVSIADGHDAGFVNEFCKLIDSQPTAYDVGNVCKKINENKEIDNMIDADHAIKIVKESGVNEI